MWPIHGVSRFLMAASILALGCATLMIVRTKAAWQSLNKVQRVRLGCPVRLYPSERSSRLVRSLSKSSFPCTVNEVPPVDCFCIGNLQHKLGVGPNLVWNWGPSIGSLVLDSWSLTHTPTRQ